MADEANLKLLLSEQKALQTRFYMLVEDYVQCGGSRQCVFRSGRKNNSFEAFGYLFNVLAVHT